MVLRSAVLLAVLFGLNAALVCPDGGMCEDKNTCCMNTEGGYGCCPLPHAQCCSDRLHCCFEGTLCDLVHQKCVNKTASLPWIRRVPAQQAPPTAQPRLPVNAVICPDQESECPDDTTCCQLPDGSWGCCPLVKAVCCEDKQHCCPEATTCDLVHSKCVSASSLESRPLLEKLPARRRGLRPGRGSNHRSGGTHLPLLQKVATQPDDVVCPDLRTTCPDETTCCQLTNGTFGCCPMPNAVCCSDHMHCCPAGTQCDLQHSTCLSARPPLGVSALTAAAERAAPPQTDVAGAIACNDSVACADGSTCCKLAGGEWACCPLPKAVCCEDHRHCCPHGTVCNLAASTCDDAGGGAVVAPLFRKTPAFPLTIANNKCDKSTSCPGKTTCCRTLSGDWACCPLPQAVCCDDHEHCCPHGTVCNLEAQTCDDPSGSSPSRRWLEKMAAVTTETVDEKCDKQTMCPGGTTCCKKDSGQWACCPLPQAVCCDDHEHCCPHGYTCNVAEETCDKPDAPSVSWLQKTPSLQRAPHQDVGAAARPDRNMCDGRSSCPRDTTCCFMEGTQEWGCCPLPDAVCCEDGNHCCPRGHVCQPHRSSCSRGPHIVPWVTKVSARTVPTDVKCDDKSSCASGATCCKLPTGEWGCCPLVKAVCCADLEHCCPQGYTCNMQTGTCEKTSRLSLPQLKVVRSKPEGGPPVPCDSRGQFHCSEEDTCCQVSPTEWGCCPSPGAVCCPGSRSCCPAGSQCHLQAGGCTPRAGLTWDSLTHHRKRHSTL